MKPRSYFFLSYAHSAPASADQSVRTFFDDLEDAVQVKVPAEPDKRPGFIDDDLPAGANWGAALARAVGSTDVFIPLYSPNFFNNKWPLREQRAFERRIERIPSINAKDRIIPVLWTPIPPWDQTDEIRRALNLGEDIPDYAANGLRALCVLAYYEDQYREIVERLARAIVTVAQEQPLKPSSAPSPDEIDVPVAEFAFVAAVLAPTRSALPAADADPRIYGDTGAKWRPFAEQESPAADYLANTAERLGLPTVTIDYAADDERVKRHPAVLLVDPWILELPGGEQTFRDAVKSLPKWVLPLVIVDDNAPGAADQLARRAIAMLSDAGVAKSERAGNVQEFVGALATLVTQARRQYLRSGPVDPPPGAVTPRRRLGDAPDSPSTIAGTTNHA
jgi:FxsC-like protein